jgi:hypothetical protein
VSSVAGRDDAGPGGAGADAAGARRPLLRFAIGLSWFLRDNGSGGRHQLSVSNDHIFIGI